MAPLAPSRPPRTRSASVEGVSGASALRAASAGGDRVAVACLAAGETIAWAGLYYLFPALLLRWEAAEGWPKTTLTAAFAAAVVVSAIVSPLAGRLIDRGRGPAVMLGGALTGAAAVALLPFAPSLAVFAALWLVAGAAMGACLYEPCFALLTRARGAEARRAITSVTLAAGFASTISFPLAHFVAEAGGWHLAAWTMAGLLALGAAPLLFLGARRLEAGRVEDEPAEDPSQAARPAPRRLLRNPAFWLLAAAFSLLGANHGVVLNHLLPILSERGVPLDIAVLTASTIGPMQVAGRLAMLLAGGRVTSRGIATASFLAVIAGTLCLIVAQASPLLLVAFVVLEGSGYGVSSIMRAVMVREVFGARNYGAISGSVAVPYLLSYALSPYLGSLLWVAGGYDLALVTVCIGTALGLGSFRVAVRRAG